MAIIDSRTVLRVDATSSLPSLAAGDEGTLAYDQATDSFRRWTGTAWAPVSTAYGVMGAVQGGDTVANTTTATNFASNFSIPAGALAANRALIIRAWGVYSTTGTPDLTFDLRAGTTTLCTTSNQACPNNVTNQGWNLDATVACITTGVTGTVEAQGLSSVSTSPAAADHHWDMENTATVTLDTTAAQTLQIRVTWGTASASNTITMRTFTVQFVGTA